MKQKILSNLWAGIIFLGWLGCFSMQANAQAVQNALDFDGVDDMVKSQVMISNSYTKEALVFLKDHAPEETDPEGLNNNIISGSPGTANTAFWIPTGNGRRLAAGHGGKWFTVQDTAVFPTGRWVHVAVTFNADGNVLTLYKNGIQVGRASNISSTENYFEEGGDSLQIGSYIDAHFFKGALDEVRIWNYPRTIEQLREFISKPLAGTEEGLIAYYSFDQGTAGGDNTAINSLNNSVANAKNGILSGFALTGNTSNFIASEAFSADMAPPSGYTIAIDQASIDTTNQAKVSFTLSGVQDAATYYYTITDAADSVISGSGEVTADQQQVADIDVSSLNDGQLLFSLILADAVGNTGAAATATVNKDANAPSATISSTYDSVTNQSPIPLTITFSEKVKDFAVDDLVVTNGNAAELATEDSTTFTANITPAEEGEVTVEIPENTVTDVQGTANTTAASFSILYNLSTLTVELSTQADSIFTEDVLALTITFSDTVSGFTLDDLSITNGTADTLVTEDSVIFTTGITPAEAGPVTVELPAGVATSRLGNDNEEATPLSRTYEPGGAAEVMLTTTANSPTNQSPIPVTITFSSAVSGFAPTGIALQNATVEALTTSDSITFSAEVVPAKDTVISVSVLQNSAKDMAGNGNTASDTISVIYDGTAPTATISATEGDTTQASTFVASITFSEAVSNFDSTDIAIDSASFTNLQTSDSITFTADVMTMNEGEITISIADSAAVDKAGNASAAASFSIFYQESVTGIEDLFVQDAVLNMYPVPSSQYLNIAFQLQQASKVTMELRSLSGQLFKRKTLARTVAVDETLWLHHIPNGVYIITLYIDSNRVNRKIVINR